MREGDAFLGRTIHINHRFGSTGLNLVNEGLLLGMRAKVCMVFHNEASPRASTFIFNIIVNTPLEVVLQVEAISLDSEGLI
jgi:hypothetical protein